MSEKEKIPLFKNWRGWYIFVAVFLIGLIILFYLITRHFS